MWINIDTTKKKKKTENYKVLMTALRSEFLNVCLTRVPLYLKAITSVNNCSHMFSLFNSLYDQMSRPPYFAFYWVYIRPCKIIRIPFFFGFSLFGLVDEKKVFLSTFRFHVNIDWGSIFLSERIQLWKKWMAPLTDSVYHVKKMISLKFTGLDFLW